MKDTQAIVEAIPAAEHGQNGRLMSQLICCGDVVVVE